MEEGEMECVEERMSEGEEEGERECVEERRRRREEEWERRVWRREGVREWNKE